MLFAFLLTVPFASGFSQLQGTEKAAFFLAFVSTALYVRTTAVAVAAGPLVLASITWFALPLRRRSRTG